MPSANPSPARRFLSCVASLPQRYRQGAEVGTRRHVAATARSRLCHDNLVADEGCASRNILWLDRVAALVEASPRLGVARTEVLDQR